MKLSTQYGAVALVEDGLPLPFRAQLERNLFRLVSGCCGYHLMVSLQYPLSSFCQRCEEDDPHTLVTHRPAGQRMGDSKLGLTLDWSTPEAIIASQEPISLWLRESGATLLESQLLSVVVCNIIQPQVAAVPLLNGRVNALKLNFILPRLNGELAKLSSPSLASV